MALLPQLRPLWESYRYPLVNWHDYGKWAMSGSLIYLLKVVIFQFAMLGYRRMNHMDRYGGFHGHGGTPNSWMISSKIHENPIYKWMVTIDWIQPESCHLPAIPSPHSMLRLQHQGGDTMLGARMIDTLIGVEPFNYIYICISLMIYNMCNMYNMYIYIWYTSNIRN